jgi:glycosyltransferase involved in cell wall biosynthesis
LKKILLVIDEFGWAFHNHAIQIKERLSDSFDFKIVDRKENIQNLKNDFDLFFVFDPIPLKYGYPPKNKTIMSLRCQFLYEQHPQGAIGLYKNGFAGRCVSIEDKCKSLIVLNNNQYKEFNPFVESLYKISHGVNENAFNDPSERVLDSNNVRVGVVGRDSENKGFGAVKEVIESMKGFSLSHAGYNGGKKINHNDMPNFYKNIDIYVCFSKSEAVNNGLLEAGAMGVPVISTRSGASEEIINNGVNGYIINRDKDDLRKALKDIAIQEKYIDFRRNIYKTIHDNWTWRKKIQEYKDMFNKEII